MSIFAGELGARPNVPRVAERALLFWRWLMPALVPVLAAAPFLPALQGGFQQWDDQALLIANTAYRGLGWSQIRWMFTTTLLGHYMPVTWMTYGLDYLLWGTRPAGYHLSNIALHAANTTLFYFVAFRLLRSGRSSALAADATSLRVGAVLAALAFGVHPLRAESVAWVTERRDVLCGFFYLLAVLMYLRACDAAPGGNRLGDRGSSSYWAAVGFFALALLSKSMAVTLPAVLVLIDVYPLRRLRRGQGERLAVGPLRVWLEKLPFALLATAVSAGAFWALLTGAGATSLESLGVAERIALALHSVAFYLEKTLVPVALSPLYSLSLPVRILDPLFVLSGLAVSSITLAVLVLRRRWPGLLAVWTCYIVMLTPVMGIFHNGHQIAADRYTYLPCLGWALLAGGGLTSAWDILTRERRRRAQKIAVLTLILSSVGALGLATWEQVKIWDDDETLWRRAVHLEPASAVALANLGAALRAHGRLDEAVAYSRRALLLNPDNPHAHLNLARALTQQARFSAAELHFHRVLELRPRSATAHSGLGTLREAQGRPSEALEHFRLAVILDPGSAPAHNDLGVALARAGRLSDAAREFAQAVRIDSQFPEAQHNLGLTLAQTGRLSAAIEHFREAIRLRPDFAEARQNLKHALDLAHRP